jgi:hypothetical protein
MILAWVHGLLTGILAGMVVVRALAHGTLTSDDFLAIGMAVTNAVLFVGLMIEFRGVYR